MKWYIEEISTDSTSENSFIVVYPDIVVDDLADCCQALYSENLKKMRVLIDKRTPVSQTSCFSALSPKRCPTLR